MVNPIYTKKETVTKLKKLFPQNKLLPSIQLHNFFTEEEYKKIQSIVTKTSFTHEKKPFFYFYSTAKINSELTSSLQEINKIVKTIIIKKNIELKNHQLLQFQHKDYTLLNDKKIQPAGYDIILDLTDNWQPEYGGNLIYTNGQGQSFTISPKQNTLTIIKRTTHFQKYIEYVNHYAKKEKRIFFFLSFPIE